MGYLHDFQDGQFFKEHPLFSTDHNALQLIGYFDEVEPSNPLGSYRRTHKLGKICDRIPFSNVHTTI